MAVRGSFIGLPLATLQSLLAIYLECLTALATAQSYTVGSRSFTKAQLPQVQDIIGELNAAIAAAQGRRTRRTLVSFRG